MIFPRFLTPSSETTGSSIKNFVLSLKRYLYSSYTKAFVLKKSLFNVTSTIFPISIPLKIIGVFSSIPFASGKLI